MGLESISNLAPSREAAAGFEATGLHAAPWNEVEAEMHADCSQCQDCILPEGLQPLAFRQKTENKTDNGRKHSSVTIGLAHISERLKQISGSMDEPFADARLKRLGEHVNALELLAYPFARNETRLNSIEIVRAIRPALEQMAAEKDTLLLWDVAPHAETVCTRQGRTIEALKQLGYGALRLLSSGGTLHFSISPHDSGGLCVEITANTFSLPPGWDRMHPGPNACPLPTGALSALRLALDLMEQPTSTLGVRHYPSQSTLHFTLIDQEARAE